MKKWLTIIASIIVVLLIGGYFAVGNYFYNFALNADVKKEFMENNPNLEQTEPVSAEFAAQAKQADDLFKQDFPTSSMQIVTNDDAKLTLHANIYEQKQPNHRWAIVLHGYTKDSIYMTRWIRNFYEQGFDVLAPDLRGHGQSEGDYIGMGWHDRLDTIQWMNEILKKDPQAEIVLFGVSMGGATAMMTSGEKLPEQVKVIVEDCGYSTVADLFTYQLDQLFGLPPFPVMNAANTMTNIRANYDLYKASSVEQVKKSVTPMLFIHGDADTFVPFSMLDEVYAAANVDKEKLVIEGAGHTDSEYVNPELYWNTIWRFVEKYVEL